MGAYENCPEENYPLSTLPDWESDCDVDLADFAAFQVCFDPNIPASMACVTAFDLELRCGFTDVVDFSDLSNFVQDDSETGCGGPLSHPYCAEFFCPGQQSMAGMGGESSSQAAGSGGAPPAEPEQPLPPTEPEEALPPEPVWAVVESSVALEIRPLGGGAPLALLTPRTVYEVHYAGATNAVQGYLLQVSGDCASQCVGSASPADSGSWSETGLFSFSEFDAVAWVLDDLSASELDPSPEGYLCTITTAAEGELTLGLSMYLADSDAATTYEMVGETIVVVTTP